MRRIGDASRALTLTFAFFAQSNLGYALGSHDVSTTPTPISSNVFNVKQYGATGNGTTDDTASIQAALTAAGAVTNGVVFFPTGTYLFSSALTASHVSLVGQAKSSNLLASNGANISVNGLSSSATFAISNLNFESNGTSTGALLNVKAGNSVVAGSSFATSYSTAIACNNATGVQILNNTFNATGSQTGGNIINATNCSNLLVQQNSVMANSSGSNAISVNSCTSAQVIKNTVVGNASSPAGTGVIESSSSPTINGNSINGFDNGVYTSSSSIDNPVITKNNIQNSGAYGIYTFQSNPTITGNVIKNVSGGQGIEVTFAGNPLSEPVRQIRKNKGLVITTISQNAISSVAGDAIYLNSNRAADDSVIVTQNQIANAGLVSNFNLNPEAVIYSNVNCDTTITQNQYTGNVSNLQYFIYCVQLKSRANVSGNKTSTTLPSHA